jgi:hypothetical protein
MNDVRSMIKRLKLPGKLSGFRLRKKNKKKILLLTEEEQNEVPSKAPAAIISTNLDAKVTNLRANREQTRMTMNLHFATTLIPIGHIFLSTPKQDDPNNIVKDANYAKNCFIVASKVYRTYSMPTESQEALQNLEQVQTLLDLELAGNMNVEDDNHNNNIIVDGVPSTTKTSFSSKFWDSVYTCLWVDLLQHDDLTEESSMDSSSTWDDENDEEDDDDKNDFFFSHERLVNRILKHHHDHDDNDDDHYESCARRESDGDTAPTTTDPTTTAPTTTAPITTRFPTPIQKTSVSNATKAQELWMFSNDLQLLVDHLLAQLESRVIRLAPTRSS